MKRGVAGGFTIVETMIVLAVSGVLFISMVGVIQGQQNKIQFKNSMNNVVSEIQSTIGQVSTGYYPGGGTNFICVVVGGVPRITQSSLGKGMGTNDGCTFMGQAFMLGTGTVSADQQYKTHTLVGVRKTAFASEPGNFVEAKIRVMSPGTTDPATVPDLSTTKNLQFGSKIKWMRIDDSTQAPISGFAIITLPSGQSGGTLSSIIPIACGMTANCEDGLDPKEGVDAIQNTFAGVNPTAKGVKLCFLSDSTNQSALIRVGANGGNNSSEMTIHNNQDCA